MALKRSLVIRNPSTVANGDRGTSPVLVRALLDCYGVEDPAQRDDVLDLVRADKEQ